MLFEFIAEKFISMSIGIEEYKRLFSLL